MERLTMTNDKGEGAFTFDLHVHCEPSEMRKIIKLADKLREYEDLEEQGLLVKQPFEAGDLVWCVVEDEDGFSVEGYIFMAMCGDYYIVCSDYCHCADFEEQLREMSEETENFGSIDVYIFHKDKVFHTREDAEAAVEEEEEEWED